MKRHIPIMVTEILNFIPQDAKLIVDGTFGHGGHTIEIIKHTRSILQGETRLLSFERDPQVLLHGKLYLQETFDSDSMGTSYSPCHIINDSYTNIQKYLNPDTKVDFILLDLGINREHVTDNIRGFSIQGEGPLDMRFTPEVGKTAYELIQSSSGEEIKTWFMTYADFSDKESISYIYDHI